VELTAEQVQAFHDQGYLGPLRVCSTGEMAEIRERLEPVIAEGETGGASGIWTRGRCTSSARTQRW